MLSHVTKQHHMTSCELKQNKTYIIGRDHMSLGMLVNTLINIPHLFDVATYQEKHKSTIHQRQSIHEEACYAYIQFVSMLISLDMFLSNFFGKNFNEVLKINQIIGREEIFTGCIQISSLVQVLCHALNL